MKGVAGPLMCWDFFVESHYRRLQNAEGFRQLRAYAKEFEWRIDWDLKKILLREEKVALVTDLSQIIRFATPNMVSMNGYRAEELIGREPRMLQGKDTSPETRREIKEAIVRRIPFKGSIVNYRKDGTAYNCLVEEHPVWNKCGVLVNFIAFEKIA